MIRGSSLDPPGRIFTLKEIKTGIERHAVSIREMTRSNIGEMF